jgi:cell division protein FtsL
MSMVLNVVLALAVLASALGLVHVQHASRRHYAALDQARAEAAQLDALHQHLQVQKRERSSPQHINRIARERLSMEPIPSARVVPLPVPQEWLR